MPRLSIVESWRSHIGRFGRQRPMWGENLANKGAEICRLSNSMGSTRTVLGSTNPTTRRHIVPTTQLRITDR
jgi:hypothetical protein